MHQPSFISTQAVFLIGVLAFVGSISAPATLAIAKETPSSVNLLSNSDFAAGFTDWRPYSYYSLDASWDILEGNDMEWTAPGKAPRHVLRISIPEEAHPAAPPHVCVVSKWIPVSSGEVSFSLYARAIEGNPRIELALKDTDASKTFDLTSEWQRFNLSVPLKLSAPYEKVYFKVFGPGSVEIANLQFEAGPVSTYEPPGIVQLGLSSDLDAALLHPGESFNPGFKVVLPDGVSPDSIAVTWELSDHTGKMIRKQNLRPEGEPGQIWSFSENWTAPGEYGLYSWSAKLQKDSQVISEQSYHVGVVPRQEPPKPGEYDIFGGVVTPTDIKTNLEKARRMGLSILRIHGWTPLEFYHSHGPETENWRIDSALDYAHSMGFSLLAYLTDFNAEAVVNINRRPDLQTRMADYAEALARRTKGKIHAFQIWNEPEFKVKGEVYAPYHNLLVSALREGNPDATIVGFGSVHPQNEFLQNALEAGASRAVEAIAVHCYLNGQPPESALPIELDSLLGPDRLILKQHDMDEVQIWDTESGYLTNSLGQPRTHTRAPDTYYVSKEKQAQYTVRQNLLSLALGLKTKFNFLLPSVNHQHWWPWSFFEADFPESARPAAVAMAVLSHKLRGTEPDGDLLTTDNGSVFAYPLIHPETSRKVWVVWTTAEPETVTWRGTPPVTATGMMGRNAGLDSNDSEWSVRAGPSPIILEFAAEAAVEPGNSTSHEWVAFGSMASSPPDAKMTFSDNQPPFEADFTVEAEDSLLHRWTPGLTRALHASEETLLVLDREKEPQPEFARIQFEVNLEKNAAGTYELWAATAPLFSSRFTNLEVVVNDSAPLFVRGDDQPTAYKVRLPEGQMTTIAWERIGTFPLNEGANTISFQPSAQGLNQPESWLQYFDRIALRRTQ
jgi:hypothetical protein